VLLCRELTLYTFRMKINKEKAKKIGKIIFSIAGGLAIAFIALFLAAFTIASWDERVTDSDTSYDSDDYARELSGLGSLSSSEASPINDSIKESSETYTNESSDSESTKEIKTGTLSMVLDDLDVAMEDFEDIKNKYSGSITYSYESGDGSDRYVTMTLKITSGDFEKVFKEISEIDGEIEYSYVNTSDVTEQYIDLQSRLKNLEAVEVQLVEIMETAETVEDTLAVYSELSSTRSSIEVLKGQIKYLDNQTDYSYITVTFSLSSVGADITEDEWKSLGVLKNAFRALLSMLKGFIDFLIWILVFSPIGLIIYGIYWLVNRKVKKSKK
jgi:metal-responsive CopG/Arc/MetJ family transcriptional regulator